MATAKSIDRLVFELRSNGIPKDALNLGYFTHSEVRTINAGYELSISNLFDRMHRGEAILSVSEAA